MMILFTLIRTAPHSLTVTLLDSLYIYIYSYEHFPQNQLVFARRFFISLIFGKFLKVRQFFLFSLDLKKKKKQMAFEKEQVIDAKGHLLGRLASIVAKQLLNGQKVTIVRAEEINISGPFFRTKRKANI